jgi:hypothetical protein
VTAARVVIAATGVIVATVAGATVGLDVTAKAAAIAVDAAVTAAKAAAIAVRAANGAKVKTVLSVKKAASPNSRRLSSPATTTDANGRKATKKGLPAHLPAAPFF